MNPTWGKNYLSTACISYLVYINATWHNYRAFLEAFSALLHSGAILGPQTMITCSRSQLKTRLCHLYSMEPIYQPVWDWQCTLAAKGRNRHFIHSKVNSMPSDFSIRKCILLYEILQCITLWWQVMASQTSLTLSQFYQCVLLQAT